MTSIEHSACTVQLHQAHTNQYSPYMVHTDLSQFISAVQCLQQGVHVAGGSLVLETHIACVLP